jgi:uncharacterized protein
MSEQQHTGRPGNFAEDRERASRAGQIGGRRSSGNFAHNRARAAEAGRKGGKHSRGGGGAENNPGNFARDRERASEAGRKASGRENDRKRDQVVEDSFPASDPPAASGIVGPRLTPKEDQPQSQQRDERANPKDASTT